ncbi:MAG: tripartite tricarboxylate transporter substrate-binding protein, partial [Proteobacteria bacterium]|nr:tripartite tricarboxylate transporter substrate-binding protein [Pseudomonadota bacterium]
GYRVDQTYGVVAPGRTPAPIVAKLNAEIVNILKSPEIGQRMSAEGAMLVGNTPQEYLEYLKAELQKWTKVVKEVGIRLD